MWKVRFRKSKRCGLIVLSLLVCLLYEYSSDIQASDLSASRIALPASYTLATVTSGISLRGKVKRQILIQVHVLRLDFVRAGGGATAAVVGLRFCLVTVAAARNLYTYGILYCTHQHPTTVRSAKFHLADSCHRICFVL